MKTVNNNKKKQRFKDRIRKNFYFYKNFGSTGNIVVNN
jgi:hypothetical protein